MYSRREGAGIHNVGRAVLSSGRIAPHVHHSVQGITVISKPRPILPTANNVLGFPSLNYVSGPEPSEKQKDSFTHSCTSDGGPSLLSYKARRAMCLHKTENYDFRLIALHSVDRLDAQQIASSLRLCKMPSCGSIDETTELTPRYQMSAPLQYPRLLLMAYK